MKKKHRRAVCYSIGVLWLIIISPIMILGIIGEYCARISSDPVYGRPRGWKRKGVPEEDMDSGII